MHMTPFLKQVAEHFYSLGNISDRCFIFPNRRSMAFFRKYLSETVAASPDAVPFISPQMLTINDFFFKISGQAPADRVRLLLYLYQCYRKLNPKAEALDEFVFWGDVILGDFNDVDKYLVDPKQLFANVADLKQIQADYSFLTEVQRSAIDAFISHFSDMSGKLTVDLDSDDPKVKERFLQIWNILYPLYKDFRALLDEKGLAYEGMVYRDLAERLKTMSVDVVFADAFPSDVNFVFVGLNTLNECEKTLLRELKKASRAEFCWDYSGEMIRDRQNRSSLFMEENVREFGQAAQWDQEGVNVPSVNVVSVSSSVGQAKRIPDILRTVQPGKDCAIVLPDENLLVPVLNSIPPHVQDINVTMGLPMKGSILYTMMENVAAIQLHSASRKGRWHFYHKQVWDLFSNALFKNAMDERTREIIRNIKVSAKYYIPQEELSGTPLLDTVFQVVVTDPKSRDREQIAAMSAYFKAVIAAVAPSAAENMHLALELEYAKEYYKGINMLQDSLSDVDEALGLEILPLTYIRLLAQTVGASSVPFRGEPLKGLQIMGPLETRALDFNNVIIMSSNEGVFPRRSVSSSFIPPELRKGFNLPTYELQDAIWAYYFYRMISRADNVWMLVDSRTEGIKSGEESRYIRQMEYHFGLPLKRYVVMTDTMKAVELPDIVKTPEDMAKIKSTEMSATAVQNYLACPAKFYYSVVKGLVSDDEVAETLDAGMFGNIFHEVMRSLYTSEEAMDPEFFFDGLGGVKSLKNVMRHISRDYINSWLGREKDIKAKVKALIVHQMNAIEVTGRNLVVADVIVSYVRKTLLSDLQLLKDAGKDSFEILGRELRVKGECFGFRFKGFIDRLDAFGPDEVRVVDYKTGRVLDDDIYIDDDNAIDIADKIFAPDVKDRPKIAFQFYIYDLLVQGRPEVQGRMLYNCVYSTSLLFGKLPEAVPVHPGFFNASSERLERLMAEIDNPEAPFRRTADKTVCSYCDFKTICGR